MKKILFGAVAVLLMASCSEKNESSENTVDSGAVQDTTSLTIVEDSVKNQTVVDSVSQEKPLKQDSTKIVKEKKDNKPSTNAKLIDKYLKGYMQDAKQYKEAVNNGMIGAELAELGRYGRIAQKRLKKYENEMTPEQKEKFKKANKMFGFK